MVVMLGAVLFQGCNLVCFYSANIEVSTNTTTGHRREVCDMEVCVLFESRENCIEQVPWLCGLE